MKKDNNGAGLCVYKQSPVSACFGCRTTRGRVFFLPSKYACAKACQAEAESPRKTAVTVNKPYRK
jgi:hypothetical protein